MQADLRAVIDGAINTVDFVPPISHVYCRALRDALRPMLPAGSSIEVNLRDAELVIDVRLGSETWIVRQAL